MDMGACVVQFGVGRGERIASPLILNVLSPNIRNRGGRPF